jgi:hypothetical protein
MLYEMKYDMYKLRCICTKDLGDEGFEAYVIDEGRVGIYETEAAALEAAKQLVDAIEANDAESRKKPDAAAKFLRERFNPEQNPGELRQERKAKIATHILAILVCIVALLTIIALCFYVLLWLFGGSLPHH